MVFNNERADILKIGEKVDSILNVSDASGQHLLGIKIAHNFSKFLYKKKRFGSAIQYGKYEIKKYREHKIINSLYAKALYNLGYFYYRQGDFESALPYYKEVIAINLDASSTAKAYCEIGYYFEKKGDLYRSRDYYAYGIAALEKLDKKKILIKRYLNFSNVLYQIDTHESLDKMLDALNKAETLLAVIPNKSSKDASILNANYANYYATSKRLDFFKAKYYAHKNLVQAKKEADSVFIYSSYTQLGILYIEAAVEEQKDSTLFFLNKALQYSPNAHEKSVVFDNISDYYLKTKCFSKALSANNQALTKSIGSDQYARSIPDLNEIISSDNPNNILVILIQKASILMKLHQDQNRIADIELALSYLQLADNLVDLLLYTSKEDGSKLLWRKKASEIYLKGILICEILEDKEKAFYFSEKKKALLLTTEILENTEKVGLPKDVLVKQLEMKKKVLDLEKLISKKSQKDRLSSLKAQQFDVKRAYQAFKDSVAIQFPKVILNHKTEQILELKKVQEQLDQHTVVISYVSNSNAKDSDFDITYAVIVSKTDLEILKIGNTKEIEELAAHYLQAISKPFETLDELERFKEIAFELFQLLLPKDRIKTILTNKHLMIVPDGRLQYIPFESLVVDKNSGRYLFEEHQINYAYSLSLLHHNKTITRIANKNLVTFAPIKFSHNNLVTLDQSFEEVKNITSHIGGDMYLNATATKNNFLNYTKDYKIIHLATHANFEDEPQIAFYDMNLANIDLYTYQNNAELVVMSACNTNQGSLARGEGILNLTRGFFYSGANTVVSTLWNANDTSTSGIMSDFYGNLSSGQTNSEALHNAKLNYVHNASLSAASPFYWAPFILIGDADTILFPSNTLLYWIILFPSLVLIISILIYFYKKR